MMDTVRLSLISLLLCCGLGALADNNIALSSVQGAAGTEVTISVTMNNSDAVSALQLSIPLGDNLTFVENSQKAGDRLNGHTLSAGVNNGVLNVMAYSASMAAITGNEGEICSFKLLLGNTPGTISLTPSKTSVSDADGNSLAISVSNGTVDIRGAKVQISNNTLDFEKVAINNSTSRSVYIKNVGNETLTITDISFSSSVFSTTATLPLVINAGSSKGIYVSCVPTTRGAIDEEMTIVSNNVTGNSTIRLTATPYAVNELRLGNVSGSTDEEVTIPVTMKNMDEINGLQMEIVLPNDLEYVDGSFTLSDRKQDHSVSATITDNKLTVVAYSPTDKAFTGSDGEVGSFKVKIVGSTNAYLSFQKAILSSTIDGKSVNVLSDKYGCTVSVKSPNLYANSSLDFGSIPIYQKNTEKTYTIRNSGQAPLIISNIVFANGLFSVKEELPITIDASSNKTITVVCEATEEGDVSTDMEIYSNDPNKRLFIAKISGDVFTPDYLSGTIKGDNDELLLHISLKNYSEIYGIQFDINSSSDLTSSANDITLTERGKNFSTSINRVSEGKLRMVAYSMNDQFISSGEGEVLTIKLVPKESLADGDHTITLNNIILGTKGMQNIYAGTDITIKFSVGIMPGDANGDGRISIADASLVVDYILSGGTVTISAGADMNGDGKISIADASAIVDYILSGR